MAIDREVYAKALQIEKERLDKEKKRRIAEKSILKAKRDALGAKIYWFYFVAFCKATWKGLNNIADKIEESGKKTKGSTKKLKKVKIDKDKDPFGLKELDNMFK